MCKDNNSDKMYRFTDHIDCKTSNVVYGIKCIKCEKLVYVGETGVSLYERFQNHLSAIRSNKDEPIPNHFNNNNHDVSDLGIVGIEKIKQNDILLRKAKETFWIRKFETVQPKGLNQNEGLGD